MRIALGVSGGIAAYKACEIVRGLYKAGAETHVILTRNAERFITPLTLRSLSGNRVLTDRWEEDLEATVRHIELTREIDAFVVAPATANVLAKFAHGIADDFLSTFFVAVTVPTVVAPAMNTRMWLNPVTQGNVETLRGRGVRVVDPGAGWLAEREEGWGRLAEPAEIVETVLAAGRRGRSLAGRTVLVTAGPTREPVDPVRYLTNRSSGKMGYAIAEAAARRGARVVLVSGPVKLAPPFGVEVLKVETASEMREAVMQARDEAQVVFMAAAVSDYAPVAAPSKIKKTGGSLTLTLDEGPDILAELGRDKQDRLLVGFAAETEELMSNAQGKLTRKNLDFIVANDVSRADIGFDADHNAVGTAWAARLRGELRLEASGRRGASSSPSAPEPPVEAPPPARSLFGLSGPREDGMDAAAALAAVREELGECTRCRLHEGRKNIVFGVGAAEASLMFIGEGPGADEDAQGEPFVGRAGQKLNDMIRSIELERKDVYIANVVKCRPPGNRTPLADEVAACSPFLDGQIAAVAMCSPFLFRQIEAIRPRVIVTLGSPATKLLLGTSAGITRLRGNWHEFRGIPVMPTFRPAYLLRAYTVENRRKVWDDLRAVRARLDRGS